ncbi:type 2 isopentenyl-diphosphate Delta-isomerase [Marinobacterium sp. AK62]|uniref:Isopentenyl-diphosphate delta-isomerase n=1 Tax=Marinobacterium alkalitolerans TaxID=1542925 RepID=A0ABS3Z7N9_9GAMM|nr:type 2 isopentenyl-diphosphate Delta-isomerase [Marinobacterium alkalitolerans]MBP0047725.1 type 2 isopentenyl-diphosphate Delta-isomerase [Marinobacterium alkalitolerans]
MTDPTNERKIEHIRAIERDPDTDRNARWFDRILLTNRALPEVALDQIDPRVRFLGKTLSFPLLISSMTGGDHELVRSININLARAAECCGVAMAVGSQRVMFTHPQAEASFALREHAPSTVLISNVGGVQLNYGFDLDKCQRAVDVLGADGLYFHLNPLQEAVQPEGDTDFRGVAEKIGAVREHLSVPVLLKEVGAGLSPADIALGLEQGVTHFDLAGTGGTSWSRIEHHRRHDSSDIGVRFQDWGLPTPLALKQAAAFQDRATLIASGGLRDGIDMAKSVILGASLCGMAAPLLKPAMESAEAVVEAIERLRREFITAMFLLGTPDISALFRNTALIVEER